MSWVPFAVHNVATPNSSLKMSWITDGFGATVLNLISNKFEPQGVTAIALLAESHLSIHTWPEAHYSAVDIFTCGQNMKPEMSCKYLIQALMAKEHLLRVIDRNSPSEVPSQIKTIN